MLKTYLEDNIYLAENSLSWQEAVRLAAQPLLKKGNIADGYVEAMIQNVLQNGPYIIILPGFALPHARPETGVVKTGLALLKLQQPAVFPEGKEVRVLIVLAAKGEDDHLGLLAELTDLLMDEDKMVQLFESKTREQIVELLG